MTSATGRPDFVIVGVPHSDGTVLVLASTELRQVELDSQTEYATTFDGRIHPIDTVTELTCAMGKYVMVTGDTYPEAFARLFSQWSPSDNPQDVLDAMTRRVEAPSLRAIEGGSP